MHKRYLSDGNARDAVGGISSQQTFKVTTFYIIIDQLKSALEKRIEAYSLVQQGFGVLTEYKSMSDEDTDVVITRLAGVYSKDLSSDFPAEFRQCICWIDRAVESEVPSSDSDSHSGKFRLSDSNSDSGPTPTFSCISYLLKVIILFR